MANKKNDDLILPESATFKEAMEQLTKNGKGILCLVNENFIVSGILTDGDIRNALLKDGNLGAPVTKYINRKFKYAPVGAPKEYVLKILDNKIKQVPIINDDGSLYEIVGSGYQHFSGSVCARARSPARISWAGGGTDFSNYFMEFGGVALSATIAKYGHATILKRQDKKIIIHKNRASPEIIFDGISNIKYGTKCDLILAAIKVLKPEFGFEIYYASDFSPRTGLGGSAALLSAVIGCLNELAENKLDSYSIAEHAIDIERVELRIPGGWQDQYASVFGGVNFIQFSESRNVVTPLRLSSSIEMDLESRLILCDTGRTHLGREIQQENLGFINNRTMCTYAERLKEIAFQMKTDLVRGSLDDFGRMLNETWCLKKSINKKVSNTELDNIYAAAMKAGADGGRLLGSGGGGYFLFCVPPLKRNSLCDKLLEMGIRVENIVLDHSGLKSWVQRL
jgi:D-glycero-alpha-D-manno-heptose-7-phosphate kinase